jgi:hypothetical protein
MTSQARYSNMRATISSVRFSVDSDALLDGLKDALSDSSPHSSRADMSIFGTLLSKIVGHSARAEAAKENKAAAATATTTAPTATAPAQVDIMTVLEDLSANSKQKLDWKHSIVDLMKLVGMDSSLAERKALATELGYTGDQSDTATMNIWLHEQVMKKMSENGGKVPASMLD